MLLELIWMKYSIAKRLGTLDGRVQITPEIYLSGLVNPGDILCDSLGGVRVAYARHCRGPYLYLQRLLVLSTSAPHAA